MYIVYIIVVYYDIKFNFQKKMVHFWLEKVIQWKEHTYFHYIWHELYITTGMI